MNWKHYNGVYEQLDTPKCTEVEAKSLASQHGGQTYKTTSPYRTDKLWIVIRKIQKTQASKMEVIENGSVVFQFDGVNWKHVYDWVDKNCTAPTVTITANQGGKVVTEVREYFENQFQRGYAKARSQGSNTYVDYDALASHNKDTLV